MKIKYLILIAVTLFAFQTAFAQTNKQITLIRNEVSLINKSAKKYSKTTEMVEGISLEGTEATYFSSGKGLKKIVAESLGETYKATTEFYYSGEELIFAFQKFYRYDTQIGMNPPPKVVSTQERRVYFSNEKLVKYFDGKLNIKSDKLQLIDVEKEFLEMSVKLKEAFSN
jgi:hypothetical protein